MFFFFSQSTLNGESPLSTNVSQAKTQKAQTGKWGVGVGVLWGGGRARTIGRQRRLEGTGKGGGGSQGEDSQEGLVKV